MDASCRELLVAARRGLPRRLPENSVAGVRAALAAGVDLVQVDVRGTLDGQLAVIADETLDRTTDGSGFVSNATLAQLEALSLNGATADPETQRIPTLAQILPLVAGKDALLHVDVRDRIADRVAAAIAASGLAEQVLLTADEPQVLAALYREGTAACAPDFIDPADLGHLAIVYTPMRAARTVGDRTFLAAEAGARRNGAKLLLLSAAADRRADEGDLTGFVGLSNAGVDIVETEVADRVLEWARAEGKHR